MLKKTIIIEIKKKKGKILTELWLCCRKFRKGKKYKYYLLHFAKYNSGVNKNKGE